MPRLSLGMMPTDTIAFEGRAEDGMSQQVRDCATVVWSDLAAAYWRVGQSEEGLAAVTEALNFIEETDERYQEATLYFLKGWLTLQHKSGVRNPRSQVTPPVSPEEAEGYFHRARAIARQQQAKSIELIATTSLALLGYD